MAVKITVNNKFKFIAVFKLVVIASIVFLLFECVPMLFKNIYGSEYLREVKIAVALLSFGALLYGSLDCKKKLEALYEMEDRDN
ncbi:MAG: hypothetical protein GQ550_09335 [Gammaproteobacteria bacterium]|nr:hypothetical protein [Gammaproteobacteria bacterium]